MSSIVIAVFVTIAFTAESRETAAVALGLVLTTLIAVATLRQSQLTSEASRRPYVAVTRSHVAPTQGGVAFAVTLTNSGTTPGMTINETRTVNGTPVSASSVTQQNIVYPGEEVRLGFGTVPFGSQVLLGFDYRDLQGLHHYEFQIVYQISQADVPLEAAIVAKKAS